MLTTNLELDCGKTFPIYAAVGDAPPSSTSPNPYKRRGFLRRKSPKPCRKFNLDNNSGGAGATGIRSPLAMSPSHQHLHGKAGPGVYKATTDSQINFSPRRGSPRKSRHSSPASSRSTSPHKRPWYPAGGRPSRETGQGGRGGNESTYIVHPTFRHLFHEREKSGAAAAAAAAVWMDCPSRVDHGHIIGAEIGNGISAGGSRSSRKIRINSERQYSGKGDGAQQNPQDSLLTIRGRVRDLQSRGRPRNQDREKMQPHDDSRTAGPPRSSVVFIGHHEQLLALAFYKDILFSASADGTAKAWDTYSHQCLATYEGHRKAVWGIQVSERTLITGSADGTVRFWDIESAQPLHVIDLHSAVRDVMVVGGFLAAATTNPGIEVIDLKRMKPHGGLEGHLLAVSALASIEGDDRLVSGSHDTFIRVWNPETRICEAVLSGHGGTIGALCTLFSRRPPVVSNTARHGREQKNGELLIISGSGDSTVRVWGRAGDGTGMREWTCRAVLKGHRHGVWAVHGSSHSGVFATGGGDTAVKIWAQSASDDAVDGEGVGGGVVDETPSEEHGQQHQRWECVGGVRGTAGAVGTVLMNEQALTFGTSEALIARFPLQLCMPTR